MQYQAMEPLEKEIEIQVTNSENGEIYVSAFEGNNDEIMLEKRVIQY